MKLEELLKWATSVELYIEVHSDGSAAIHKRNSDGDYVVISCEDTLIKTLQTAYSFLEQ